MPANDKGEFVSDPSPDATPDELRRQEAEKRALAQERERLGIKVKEDDD